MLSLARPLLRPLPIVGLSAGGTLLATSLYTQWTMTSTTSSPKQWQIKPYTPRDTVYQDSDFTRQDSSIDSSFYSVPRFVTHIDDAAIESLREYYDTVLPKKGKILDFCSSWVSHYPTSIEAAAESGQLQVVGLGMNKAELDANKVLNAGRLLIDLNSNPDIASALQNAKVVGKDDSEGLDASTNVVSTDYLTKPIDVLKGVRQATKPGGSVHLTVSNRCFPTKAIARWLKVNEDERLLMVGDFLHQAGWQNIEIVELSNGKIESSEQASPQQGLQGFMSWMGMNQKDPLWVVRAVKQ